MTDWHVYTHLPLKKKNQHEHAWQSARNLFQIFVEHNGCFITRAQPTCNCVRHRGTGRCRQTEKLPECASHRSVCKAVIGLKVRDRTGSVTIKKYNKHISLPTKNCSPFGKQLNVYQQIIILRSRLLFCRHYSKLGIRLELSATVRYLSAVSENLHVINT